MDWIQRAAACPVLKGVEAEELLELFSKVQFQIRSYKKNEVLAFQGAKVNRLMILLEGSTRGEMVNPAGQVVRIEDVEAPKPLAGAFLFGHDNRFPVDVIANESVKVLVIFRDEFVKVLTMNQTIQMNYINLVSSKAQFLTRKIRFLTFRTIRAKLAYYLLSLQPAKDGELIIPASQQDLADLFGVARPSVARAISDLEQEGLVSVKNRRVRVLDKKRLAGCIEE